MAIMASTSLIPCFHSKYESLHPYERELLLIRKVASTRRKWFCGILRHNLWSYKVLSSNILPLFSLHTFINFIQKELSTTVYSVFYRFSWGFKVTKFWMIGRYLDVNSVNRSSHPEVFCKKGVLRYFAKFTGKHVSGSLF